MEIQTTGVTKQVTLKDFKNGYVSHQGKVYKKEALESLKPDLFLNRITHCNFGTKFPKYANKGDMFTRVDVLPNRVYKFDSNRWIEVNKEHNTSYLSDEKYLHFLIEKIESGEIDIEILTEEEKLRISEFLTNNER